MVVNVQVGRESRVQKLLDMLDRAVSAETSAEITEKIKNGLSTLIRSGEIVLPEKFFQPHENRYARRLLHVDDEKRYSVVVMTWGPTQSTPIHDHCGMWCVEGVLAGEIEVEQLDLVSCEDERYRFEKQNLVSAAVASAGCLIPPFEYHRIQNADISNTAVTIHVYGGEMKTCNIFEAQADGTYRPVKKELGFDN